ncbi:MAG TPA: hypothetical protein P5295_02640 [Spirochaetota bacterium]|nr:hypothetical protein [Spirochaetota bacterium]
MGSISTGSIILYSVLAIVIALLVVGFIFLRRKMQKKLDDQQSLVNQHKVPMSILVLEKRMDRVSNANMPKSVLDQIPKIYKVKKVPIVKAKVGPQVMDLLCDEEVFDKLPERKTVRVDMAGIFIAGIKSGKK